MQIFRAALVIAWLIIVTVTVQAIASAGLADSVSTFQNDLSHPWRAQYYTDLLLNFALIGIWVMYREKQIWCKLVWGVAAIFLGSLFSLPYIFITTFRVRGDVKKLLIGEQSPR